MKLKVVDVALEALGLLRRVQDPGNRKSRFHPACGSAHDARAGVRAAMAWGYVGASACEPGLAHLDRVVATLYKLTH